MTRVLVTGAGGFIGGHVLRRAPDDWDVVALSTRPAPATTRADWLTFASVDALPAALGERPFDAVIHLAGNADHGLAVREPWRDVEATAVLGARLLSAVRARRIVLLSSAAVYAGLVGPSYETPAEIRMLRTLGADAVGMSTVLEVIALRHAEVRVGAVSVVTNLAAGLSDRPLDHAEVQAAGEAARDRLERLLSGWVERLAPELARG